MAATPCHHHLESQLQYDKILAFQWDILITLSLLHAALCSSQLTVICYLGLAIFLHWHRYVPSEYCHSCCFHSSGIDNLLLYCPHHQHAWWWSWNGRETPSIRLVCPVGSFGSRNIRDPCGQSLGWICALVACPPISLTLWAWWLSHAHAFCNAAEHYWTFWTV